MVKQLQYITYSLLAALLMLGCSEELTPEDSCQISFTTSVQDHTGISRATIFENEDDILNDAADGKGGGNLTMHAYVSNTGTERFKSRAWYFNKVWRFYDASSNKFYNHYWPNYSLDFFAYMPWDGSGRLKNIKVDKHVAGTGLTINCTMQGTTADNIDETDDLLDPLGQETIIAYTPNKHKDKVILHFVHPFAAVSFGLKQAHRNLTINWIRFNNVYLTGTTTLNTTTDKSTKISWTGTGAPSTFNIPVGKTIPDQINFGAKIGGPYLVMPQSFGKGTESTDDDITITINYTWNNEKTYDDEIGNDEDYNSQNKEDEKNKNNIYQIKRTLTGEWLAGNKYNYVLNLGDNQEEILFKVEVEPWEVTGGTNNIFDVE